MGKCFFIRTSPVLVFHTHTCLVIACLHSHCMLAYSPLHIMLAYLHLHTLTLAYFALRCFRSSSVCVCVCQCECRSVSVEVSVFKGFSGRTLRNAFGKNTTLRYAFSKMQPPSVADFTNLVDPTCVDRFPRCSSTARAWMALSQPKGGRTCLSLPPF